MVKRNRGLLNPVSENEDDETESDETKDDSSNLETVVELWNDFVSELEQSESAWRKLKERIESDGFDSLPIRLQRWFARGPMRGHFHYAVSFLFEEVEMAKSFECLYLKGESDE